MSGHPSWYRALEDGDEVLFGEELRQGRVPLDEEYRVEGWTMTRPPLFWAVRLNRPWAVTGLLRAGANDSRRVETEHGSVTALHYAQALGFGQCVEAFEDYDQIEKNISLIMTQHPDISRAKAEEALKSADFDVVDALLLCDYQRRQSADFGGLHSANVTADDVASHSPASSPQKVEVIRSFVAEAGSTIVDLSPKAGRIVDVSSSAKKKDVGKVEPVVAIEAQKPASASRMSPLLIAGIGIGVGVIAYIVYTRLMQDDQQD